MLRNHDLNEEFPKKQNIIHRLKIENQHFKRLFDEYHDVNDEIHRIESGAESTTDQVLNDLRKQRLHLKDELYRMIVKKEAQ